MTTSDNPTPHAPDDIEEKAYRVFRELVGRFEALLLAEAVRRNGGRPISAGDLEGAYRDLIVVDPAARRDTQSLVTTALRENRRGEWVAYSMATILFLLGIALLIAGLVQGRYEGIVGGAIAEVVFLIPLRTAMNIRRHNIALRFLGALLSRVDDPKVLAPLLKRAFPMLLNEG